MRLGENAAIDGLFTLLPPAGAVWPTGQREQWLTAAAAILGLLYDRPTGRRPEQAAAARATGVDEGSDG